MLNRGIPTNNYFTMKTLSYYLLLPLLLLSIVACKKDKGETKVEKVLAIENGAMTVSPSGASVTYSAVLIDKEGNRTPATGVTWSSSETSIATISATGVITVAQPGVTTIKASVTIDGTTLTAEAPLNILVPGIFAVLPSAILVDTEFPDIQLEPVYLGTGTTTYTYQSSNNNIATVSSSGLVDFKGAGSCQITVTATGLDGSPSIVVPVVVLGAPTVELPVARVVVSPANHAILKNETAQFSAKAYRPNGQEVNTSFAWSLTDPTIASIDATGKVTPLKIGSTMVRAMAEGVVGEAELTVVADKVIIVTPYYATVAAGATRQFTATQYQVVRSAGELVLGSSSTPNNLTWEIPTYGFSMFDIATINSSGLATVKSSAIAGMMTFVLAYNSADPEIEPGVGVLGVAVSSPCNCPTAVANAAGVSISSPTTLNLSFGQTAQIQAQVVDAMGNAISGASIEYCSSDIQVVNVDFNGEVSVASFTGGTADITVCHGSFSQTITVNVQ